jgi:hypothetical protein
MGGGGKGMMRDRKTLRRRSVAVAALMIALCVGAPELVDAAGAATTRSEQRTELQARVTTRPAAVARRSAQQPGAAIRAQRARRKAARAAKARKRRRTVKKRRASAKKKRTAAQRKAAQRRNAAKAKRTANRKKRNAAAAKKANGGGGGGLTLAGWAEVLFFALLPFIAVAALLFWTDYQRKPRAPSRPRRKRSLVITPVSRKF